MSLRPRPPSRLPQTHNRFAAALCHISRYNGRYALHLPKDTGLKTEELRLILDGRRDPSHTAAVRIWRAICKASGRDIPLEDLIRPYGEPFPTKYPCQLFACRCHPPWAWENDELKPEFQNTPAGTWTFEVPSSPH